MVTLVFYYVVSILPPQATVEGPEAQSRALQEIIHAWRERDRRFRAWDCAWSAKRFQSKESIALVAKGDRAKLKDMSFDFRMRLVVDLKNRFRFEEDGTQWSQKANSVVPRLAFDVLNGNVRKSYLPKAAIPGGFVQEQKATYMANDARYLPLLLFFRPFSTPGDPFLTVDALQIISNQALVNEKKSLLLEHRKGRLWVDSNAPYLPLRYTMYTASQKNVPSTTVDWEYKFDSVLGWLPSTWKYTWLGPEGNILDQVTSQVTSFVFKDEFPDDIFDLEFAPGTWVNDGINNESYIVKDGGLKRPVAAGEFTGDNFPQIQSSGASTIGPWYWLMLAFVPLCLLSVLLRKRIALLARTMFR